jgi:curved DNA-binding protein CbpA
MELADCYRLLGLRKGASHDEIKSSYRRLARQYHPDANPGDLVFAKEKFIQLTNAYRQLINAVPSAQMGAPTVDLKRGREQSQKQSQKQSQNRTAASRQARPDAKTAAKTSTPTSTPTSGRAVPSPKSTSPGKTNTQPDRATANTPESPAKPASPSAAPLQHDPNLSVIDRKLKERIYEQLQQLLRDHRFAMAITVIEGLAQRLPSDREVRQWQAITYQRFGRHLINDKQPDKARIYLQKALRTDPQNRSLWYEVDREMRRLDQIEVL